MFETLINFDSQTLKINRYNSFDPIMLNCFYVLNAFRAYI